MNNSHKQEPKDILPLVEAIEANEVYQETDPDDDFDLYLDFAGNDGIPEDACVVYPDPATGESKIFCKSDLVGSAEPVEEMDVVTANNDAQTEAADEGVATANDNAPANQNNEEHASQANNTTAFDRLKVESSTPVVTTSTGKTTIICSPDRMHHVGKRLLLNNIKSLKRRSRRECRVLNFSRTCLARYLKQRSRLPRCVRSQRQSHFLPSISFSNKNAGIIALDLGFTPFTPAAEAEADDIVCGPDGYDGGRFLAAGAGGGNGSSALTLALSEDSIILEALAG